MRSLVAEIPDGKTRPAIKPEERLLLAVVESAFWDLQSPDPARRRTARHYFLDEADGHTRGLAGWRQGFTSNITNPKVLVFYLAVLPQFLTPGAGLGWLLVLAWSHAVLGLSYQLTLVTGLHGARRLLMRRKVRRGLDATTGAVLLGFSAKLAAAHV